MKIGVIGLGKLGLPLAVVLSKHFNVYGVDLNPKRIQQILNREHFFEPKLNEYLEKQGDNLTVSLSYEVADECDVVFILTQTPSLSNGKFDLQYVESALTKLHKVNPDCLAVTSSTINIGDMNKLRKIHLRICYNPEFIRQGTIIQDFENPKFILIGAYDKRDGELLRNLWGNVHCKPVHIVTPIEAEIAKLSLNVSFTLGINFANVIGETCRAFHADANKVLDILYKDRRNYKPGLGFGGPCFPRDVTCFESICQENSVRSGVNFVSFIRNLNDYWVDYYYDEIVSYKEKRVGILGIGYKLNVPYTVDSQPLKIAQRLCENGYEVHVYDPLAEAEAKEQLPNAMFHPTLEDFLKNVKLVFMGLLYRNSLTKLRNKIVVNPWVLPINKKGVPKPHRPITYNDPYHNKQRERMRKRRVKT